MVLSKTNVSFIVTLQLMKIKNIMSLAFTATLALFVSCSNDYGNPEVPNAEMALVQVSFAGASPGSRAFDPENQGTDIRNLRFYYSIGNKYFDPVSGGYMSAPDVSDLLGVSGATYSIPVPSNAEKLYVVTNLGAETEYPAASDLKNDREQVHLMSIIEDGVTSSGVATLSFTTAPAGTKLEDGTEINLVAEAKVEMKFIPARIDVTLINEMENYGVPGALSFNKVAILYCSQKIYAIPPFKPRFQNNAHGLSGWGDKHSYFVYPVLAKVWTPTAANVPEQDLKHTFYTFPPIGGVHQILTAVASRGDETIYFPVHFNGIDIKHTIEYSTRYNVTMTFRGDATQGYGGGTGDPEIPIQDGAVTVEITPAEWNVIDGIENILE